MTDSETPRRPNRKLARCRDDRYIGGVASGIAKRFSIDPALVRIGFIISLAFGGIGAIGYLVLLVMLPIDGDPDEPVPPVPENRRIAVIAGTILLGLIFLFTRDAGGWLFGIGPGPLFGIIIWALAIAGLIWLIREGTRSNPPEAFSDRPSPSAVASPSQTAPAGPMPAGKAAAADAPTGVTGTAVTEVLQGHAGATSAVTPSQTASTPSATAGVAAGAATGGRPATTETLAEQQERSGGAAVGKIMTWFAIGITALIALSIVASISAWVTVIAGAIPMATLVVGLGVAMVVLALTGWPRIAIWLVPVAIFVAIPMAFLSIADIRLHGAYGSVDEAPVATTDIPASGYKLAAGDMTIDMRGFDFQPGETVELPVDSGLGFTEIIVPDRVCVTADVTGKAGLADIRGTESSGVDVDRSITAPESDAPRLHLDGDFQLGFLQVVDSTGYVTDAVFDSDGYAYEDSERWDRRQEAARTRARAACEPSPPPKAPSKKLPDPAGETTTS